MNAHFPWTTRLLIAVLTFALCGGPQFASAQQQETTTPAASPDTQAPMAGQQESPAPATDTEQPTDEAAAPADQQQEATQVPAPSPQTADPNAPARPGTLMDPAAGPLQPVPSTTLPNAPSASQQDQTAQPGTPPPVSSAPTRPKERDPLGTATAEGGRTVGGAASRPAGTAIAPAKQRQTRSFLIKLGAIAGAGIAIGTVYALSRGTSSTPPNASTGTRQ